MNFVLFVFFFLDILCGFGGLLILNILFLLLLLFLFLLVLILLFVLLLVFGEVWFVVCGVELYRFNRLFLIRLFGGDSSIFGDIFGSVVRRMGKVVEFVVRKVWWCSWVDRVGVRKDMGCESVWWKFWESVWWELVVLVDIDGLKLFCR